MNKNLIISEEVADSLASNMPVVALESTIISHGMPYPQNVETALDVEGIIRDEGAIPATVAIIKGEIHVGLTSDQISYLGERGTRVTKVSRLDFPVVLANKMDGATTVAGTMIAANMAGIDVFATGGLGGVHRGASKSFDISADLKELSHTKVTVVCAGFKSILNLGLSMEYLETNGVLVLGYKTEFLPAFYSRKSKISLIHSCTSIEQLANIIQTKNDMQLKGGIVVANPIPKKHEIDFDYMEKIINSSIKKARKSKIKGKDITPFLLENINKKTKGKSLESNIHLVKNNALVAARLAKELKQMNDLPEDSL